MAVDKKQTSAPAPLSAALAEAQIIVEAARTRAAEIEEQAQRDYEVAKANGYRDGFAAGQNEAAGNAVRLVEESTALGEHLSEEAAKLAVAIAATVITEQVKLSPDVVKRIALRAIQDSVIGDTVTLVVHPEDREAMERAIPELRRVAGNAGIGVDTDPILSRGGVRVRTDYGEVDASIDALVRAVARRIGVRTS